MRGMCEVERKRFNFRPARAYAEKLVAAAQSLAQTELVVIANAQLGLVYIQMGEYTAAHAAMQQMIHGYQLVP